MKKLILLLSFATPLWSLAQSATILPNSLGVPKVASLPTCNTAAKGNQVLNTTDNKMYYCNGTNWQEMTGGGFTLPYSQTVSSPSPLLYLENSGSGRTIYAKSTGATAIRAESGGGYGLYAVSDSYYAVYGTSSTSIAIYGNSNSHYAGYFVAYGSQPTLYVSNGGSGMAADFRGDVNIRDELTVDDGKGIVRSNSSTQQKVVRTTGGFGVTNLAVGGYVDSGSLNYENFGGIPTVTVGQILNASATGEWYKVLIIPINVTATECQLRIVNLASDTVTFSGTWHFLIVGPE
jgi:hypothetical protein